MSTQYPSIYSTVVFDLHPRVKTYLDQLNTTGQIDNDDNGYPFLIKIDKNDSNFIVYISRNNQMENFVINPRKKADPILSWNNNDKFIRAASKKSIILAPHEDSVIKTERNKRTSLEECKKMVEFILNDGK